MPRGLRPSHSVTTQRCPNTKPNRQKQKTLNCQPKHIAQQGQHHLPNRALSNQAPPSQRASTSPHQAAAKPPKQTSYPLLRHAPHITPQEKKQKPKQHRHKHSTKTQQTQQTPSKTSSSSPTHPAPPLSKSYPLALLPTPGSAKRQEPDLN